MKKTTVTRTSLPPFEEFCAQIRPLWDSRILTNMGSQHEAFRAALEQYLEVPHAVPFTNGHLALEAALRALRLPAGAEVVTTPFTFVSTVHAIVRCGFVPVFCDVREEDGTLDPALSESLLTERTAAVLPVHVYGNVCDVERIGAFAARNGLKVLYDAAHAFSVRLNGESAARFGDVSVFSFHATKVFSTVEGGAVCTADGTLLQALEDEKNFGIRDEEHCAAVGGNAGAARRRLRAPGRRGHPRPQVFLSAGAGPGMLCRHALRGCGPRAGGPEPCRPGTVPAPLRRPAGRRGGPYL